MKFFAGIIPSEKIYDGILQIQNRFGDNRLEPHITIRPPVSPLNEGQWLNTIIKTAANLKPFAVELAGTGNFGKRVLFVSVNSDPLTELYHLLMPALKIFEPKEANKDAERFHPHMTLGRVWCGFTTEDFKNMKQLAEEFLSEGNRFFEARSIRIYHKPNPRGRYQPYKDIPLGG